MLTQVVAQDTTISERNIALPKVTVLQLPNDFSRCLSCCENPPSGPINTAIDEAISSIYVSKLLFW